MFQNTTPIVINLIIINVIVYFTGEMLHTTNSFLSLHYVGSSAFNPIQFFTYMFVHGSTGHIFSNMLGLFFFGPVLERYWGSKKFLIYYIVCGVGAGMLYSGYIYYELYELKQAVNAYIAEPNAQAFASFLQKHAREEYLLNGEFIRQFELNPTSSHMINESIEFVKRTYIQGTNTSMVGASGALYAVLFAVGFLFPAMEVFLLFPPIPLKMVYLVIFYGVMAVYGMVQQQPGDNVAHFAHLSGMLVGFVLLRIWKERRPNYY